jgi:hypothetical protein
MRAALAIALSLISACYADRMLAPPRVASTIEIREVTPLRPPYLVDIDGVITVYARDSLRLPLRLQDLNSADVESITMYKGAAARQLYGTRNPCAAIVIRTKHAARSAQR